MITEWRFDKPPDEEEVIVSIHDDDGDLPFDYTTSGWYFKGNWIVDNKICYHVAAWAPLPPPVKVGKYDYQEPIIMYQNIVTATCPRCGHIEYLITRDVPQKCPQCGLEWRVELEKF